MHNIMQDEHDDLLDGDGVEQDSWD
jgi:hypothetical protein